MKGNAQQFPVKNYTIQDGLSGMQVMTISEDKKGFLWATTKMGISRFDGNTFTHFPLSMLKNIQNPQLCSGFVDTDEGVYFTSGRVLILFNGKRFISIPLPKGTIPKLWMKPQLKPNGELIVFAVNHEEEQISFLWNFKEKKWKKLVFPKRKKGEVFTPLYYHPSTNEWFGVFYTSSIRKSSAGFYGLKNSKYTLSFPTQEHPHTYLNVISKDEILVSIVQKDGSQHALLKVKEGPWINWIYKPKDREEFQVQHTLEKELIYPQDDKLFLLEAHSRTPQLIAKNVSYTNQFIRAGETNAFWVATEKGLLFFPNAGIRYFTEQQVPSAWSVVQGADSSFWFMNFGSELQRFDGKKIFPEKRHLKLLGQGNPPIQQSDLTHFYYRAFTDNQGKTWFPSSGSLYVYQSKSKKFELINREPAYCLLNDTLHRLVLQGSHNKVIVTENTPPYTSFSLEAGKDLIDFSNFMNLFMDSKKRYWLGGWAGMNRFDSVDDLRAKKSKEYSLRKGNIPFKSFVTMYEDIKKRIWVGTFDGIYYYNEQKDTFIAVEDERIKGLITFITHFDEHHFLVGVSTGLFLFNRKEFEKTGKVQLQSYNIHNGYLGLEPGQLGDYHDQDGKIWITSGSVLSYINPKKLKQNQFPLRSYIQTINKEFILYSAREVTVPNKSNQVFLEVGATGMNRPFEPEFSYFIEGVSEEWSPWQTSRQIYLGILPNGKHTVKVRTKGENNEQEHPESWAEVTIIVDAYFWKSPNLFKYATFILLFLGILTLILNIRWRKSQRALLEKERQISQLRLTLQQMQITPHFISNALTRLENRLLEGDWEQFGRPFLEKLKILIRRTLELSVQISKNNVQTIPLSDEIDYLQKYLQFEMDQYRQKRGFTYHIDCGELDTTKLLVPPLLIHNYVENAVIHGVKRGELPYLGQIHIQFYIEKESLHCIIKDNGNGSQEARQSMTEHEANPHISVGNQLVMARIINLNQQGYQIEIDKKTTIDGTIVHLTIQNK